MKLHTFISLAILSLTTSGLFAQSDKIFPIRYAPEKGAYLYFANQALSAQTPYEKMAGVRISRNTGKGFRELVKLGRSASVAEFRKVAGDDTWKQFLLMKRFKSDDEAWRFILAHPALDDYGTLAFDMKFRQAMGNAYLDTEAIGLAAGTKWTYKIEMLDAVGATTQTLEGTITGGNVAFRFGKPRKASAVATDSTVFGHWYVISKTPLEGVVMADVYRQEGGRGSYGKLSSSLLATTKGDSILFYLNDKVMPSTLYRYFIRPRDEWSNTATPSDTINILSFNFANLPPLQNVRANDTLNAILLRWKPLGDQPQLTGIEIQRSRDARGNYVVLDTVSISENGFLDTSVFPAIPYFYRLRLITIKGMARDNGFAGYANASVRNSLKRPDPPYALTGSLVKGKVTLSWQGVADSDLYGYFVYRSTSDKGRFDVISPSLSTTTFTDTSSVSGRTQYVYAVKAVNKNSLESEFSNQITMRQAVMELPVAPGGVQAYADNRKIILNWNAAVLSDHAIAGYNIYRREVQPENNFDLKQPAAAQAVKLKFVLLNRSLMIQPHYEDLQAVAGVNYEYAVSSVDVFGMEGTYSPFAKVTVPVMTRVVSTCTLRKVSTGIELVWDKGMTAGADAVIIYRKKAGEAKFLKIGSASLTQTLYTDKTAQKNALYVYVISAEKGNVILAKSEEKNIYY
jgi:fibronectin type 3 domain-containing protein